MLTGKGAVGSFMVMFVHGLYLRSLLEIQFPVVAFSVPCQVNLQ